MQMPQVQIMVYGQNLAELEAQQTIPASHYKSKQAFDNPNYAFL